jgi:ketosteroid isomerase-like protein
MKSIPITLFSLCYFFGLSQKAPEHVLSLMHQQESAWNRGDIPGFMEHYWKSDSLKFIGSKGITYGWEKTLENYKRSYPDQKAMGQLAFTIIQATSLSDSAVYVIGKWELKKEKPASGHFTLLWRKIGDKWVIVSDHTS